MTTDDLVHHGERSDRIVVGVGASAGGLAALRVFFSRIPRESGLTFVVMLHLSPDHESPLADVLQAYVQMSVIKVTETVPLKTNHVYVIPPGHNLTAVDTHLRLDKLEDERRKRAPIDHFFRTLGKTHDGQSIGVILTGTGSDGTLGLKEIKARDGVVIVQEPTEAEYSGMPQSAVATGMVDAVLPLDEIPGKILAVANASKRVAVLHDCGALNDEQLNVLHKIFAQIRAGVGRDFSRYKRSTILRRISRRMQLCQITDLSTYVSRLREESSEVHGWPTTY